MLERLRIKNFKAWRDTGDIELAPITIFFGTNSSGKSSLTQLLLLLQQTAQSSDRRRVLHLGDDRSTIDLGTFKDMIHGHDPRTQLEFELAWRTPNPVEFKDPRPPDRSNPTRWPSRPRFSSSPVASRAWHKCVIDWAFRPMLSRSACGARQAMSMGMNWSLRRSLAR